MNYYVRCVFLFRNFSNFLRKAAVATASLPSATSFAGSHSIWKFIHRAVKSPAFLAMFMGKILTVVISFLLPLVLWVAVEILSPSSQLDEQRMSRRRATFLWSVILMSGAVVMLASAFGAGS